jgi:hypothetical protein
MEPNTVFENEMTMAIKSMLNCRAPGREQTAYFWLTPCTVMRKYLVTFFHKLTKKDQIP